jgi:hypothetical protein
MDVKGMKDLRDAFEVCGVGIGEQGWGRVLVDCV